MSFLKNLLGGHHGRGTHGGGKHHGSGHWSDRHDRHGRYEQQQTCDGNDQVIGGGRAIAQAPVKDLQTCKHCRTANAPSARFCLNCGTPLSSDCTACGSSLTAGAKFCSQCGQATP
ncbi:zinc ribbon domain-containing protein [Pseudomonas putida]|nr:MULTISPECIES: zinc ribbon domain-containing protein [Pseudomonas]AVD93043.1 adenylate cyclase [Pseudomonas sp. SWI36]MCI1036040.1 zinc ribbon domain-containing protein [Pseudomonas putida]HDS1747778.1 zinc ribbon domain-containing protein [Pseudomonas putida]HEK1690653.1 zinc ribbon domain-containing protein [Pseudomonas putida]